MRVMTLFEKSRQPLNIIVKVYKCWPWRRVGKFGELMLGTICVIGWFQKISIPIPQVAFWNSQEWRRLFELEMQRHRGTYDWNSEGMRAGSVSRGDRYECWCTNELTKSKIQDKHRSLVHAFTFIYWGKAVAFGLLGCILGSKDIKVDKFHVRKSFATNTDPPCVCLLCAIDS